MWRSYFGERCRIYGVDIEKACKAYKNDFTTVFIGDQEDVNFWRTTKEALPPIDILIDDGGHTPGQQRVTLEGMLPSLSPGGVYICEDIHRKNNDFSAYATSLVDQLNDMGDLNSFQKSINSIHFYPYCMVIEKNEVIREKLFAPKQGTEWQPFFDQGDSGT